MARLNRLNGLAFSNVDFPEQAGPISTVASGAHVLGQSCQDVGLSGNGGQTKKMREKMMINIDETLTEFIKLLKIGM